jgi:hypothetical protein
MRLRTPSTVPTWDIVVRKPGSEHMTVPSLLAGDRRTASERFGEAVGEALQAARNTLVEADPNGWAVFQFSHSAGEWLGLEPTERFDIRCTDGGDGEAAAEALRAAFEGLDIPVPGPTAGSGEDLSAPTFAFYGGVIFGLGDAAEARAELVPDTEARTPSLEGSSWPPIRCPACRVDAPPSELAWGYPTPWFGRLIELLMKETEDKIRLMGCCIPEEGFTHWACQACEAPYFPGWLSAEDVAAAAVRGCKPVAGCPRFFKRGETVLWSPEAETEGEGQRYAIAPGMAARLDEASTAWVGFRPKNGATLFVDWTAVRVAAPGPIERPLAFSTRLGKQVVRVRGHILAAKLVV